MKRCQFDVDGILNSIEEFKQIEHKTFEHIGFLSFFCSVRLDLIKLITGAQDNDYLNLSSEVATVVHQAVINIYNMLKEINPEMFNIVIEGEKYPYYRIRIKQFTDAAHILKYVLDFDLNNQIRCLINDSKNNIEDMISSLESALSKSSIPDMIVHEEENFCTSELEINYNSNSGQNHISENETTEDKNNNERNSTSMKQNEYISLKENDNDVEDDLSEKDDLSELERFNLGAFLLAPLWCLTYNRVFLGIVLIILSSQTRRIPEFGIALFIIGIIIQIYVGISANKHLWNKYSNKYETVNQMIETQKKWIPWGILLRVIYFILIFSMNN